MDAETDLGRLLLQREDLPPDYTVTEELLTEEPEDPAEAGPEGERVLDARGIAYTSGDGQRVVQATLFLSESPDAARRLIPELISETPDQSDPHALRAETRTDLPDLGEGAIATSHVLERDEEQAMVHMVAFAHGTVTAVLVLWDLSEELDLEDVLPYVRAFHRRVAGGGQ